MFIGQDRAGKTSLKNSLIGLPFNPNENSTVGVEVDPSIFQVDVNKVRNWQPTEDNEQELLGCSEDVAQVFVEKLFWPGSHNYRAQEEKESTEKSGSEQLENVDNKNEKKVGDTDDEKEEESSVKLQVCLNY